MALTLAHNPKEEFWRKKGQSSYNFIEQEKLRGVGCLAGFHRCIDYKTDRILSFFKGQEVRSKRGDMTKGSGPDSNPDHEVMQPAFQTPKKPTIMCFRRHINVLHLAYITVTEFDIEEMWEHLHYNNCKLWAIFLHAAFIIENLWNSFV